MKRVKRVLALLAAFALVLAMAVPAFATSAKDVAHTFDAYQIFSGTMSEEEGKENALGDVKWGTGIANPEQFLAALKADAKIGSHFTSATTAKDVANAMVAFGNKSAEANAFARIAYANKSTTKITGDESVSISNAGYYLFVDTTSFGVDDTDTVFGLALLNVAKGGTTVKPEVKAVTPTVTKEVYDNDDGNHAGEGNNNGFNQTADHAINESFQFKLKATLPANTNFGAYKSYKVVFHDTMSKGITYESLESVTIGDTNVTSDAVVSNITAGADGSQVWTVTIADIKTAAPSVDLTKGTEIEVIYNAHLNENAEVTTASGTTSNKNTVYLEYSNNPNADGSGSTGKTPDETVYVFTYQITNTKYKDEVRDENVLKDAEFKLYKNEECTDEVKLVLKAGAYYPVSASQNGVTMVSGSDGKFNIKGLDAGTYYLKETKAPGGYNTCDTIIININASHKEDAAKVGYVDLTGSQYMENAIVDKSGTTLPSTGGMGTTVFYVVGGGLMAVAVVLLVTKKRMENKR